VGLSIEFWLQIIVFLTSFAFSSGIVWTKIKNLEKKQDKHNKLIERMTIVEQSTKSAHHRLDDICDELHGGG
jgi:membrane protein implicated in regulation of membrane protease activity